MKCLLICLCLIEFNSNASPVIPIPPFVRSTEATPNENSVKDNYYVQNTIPKDIAKECHIAYECKRKLKQAEVPKPCVKYCVKLVKCPDGRTMSGEPTQCLELNEELVAKEYNENCRNETASVSMDIRPVTMIDFPCQPGYWPDSRGRCREIW